MDNEYGVQHMHQLIFKGAKYVKCKCIYKGCDSWDHWFTFKSVKEMDGKQGFRDFRWFKMQGAKYHSVRAHAAGVVRIGPFL